MRSDLHGNVQIGLAVILGVLVTASLVTFALGRLRPGLDLDEVRSRIKSWWLIAGLFGLSLALERGWALFFFAWVSYLALKEYLSLIPTRRADRRVLLWAYAAIPLQYLWIHLGWYGMFVLFVPVFLFLAIPTRMVLIGETAGFLRAAGTIHWGAMTTVFCIGHVAYLLVLPSSINPNGAGPALVLFLVVLTQLNDVAQFLWGKATGRARVEGAVAGLLISVFGFVGDVVISAIKRDLQVKDSGALLPGHGGILDRLDSLTFTAPLFFHFTFYLYS
jgi:phosphatidate cytidylyltransferase